MAENYPGNSNKQKAEATAPAKRRVPISVVDAPVRLTKPSLGLRVRETFVVGGLKTVAGSVFFDVVIPAVKAMLYDGISTGADRMLYGGDGGSPRTNARRTASNGSKIDYHAISQTMSKKKANEKYPGRDFEGTGGNTRAAADSIIAPTRAEAEKIVIELQEYINDYDWVSRAEFLAIAGHTGEFTDEKYGWSSIDGYRIRPVRDGFQLDLPRAEYDQS